MGKELWLSSACSQKQSNVQFCLVRFLLCPRNQDFQYFIGRQLFSRDPSYISTLNSSQNALLGIGVKNTPCSPTSAHLLEDYIQHDVEEEVSPAQPGKLAMVTKEAEEQKGNQESAW